MSEISESLRQAMRRWTTGVSIVTSRWEDVEHGMTVNSFTSLSLDPPYITVTLANNTRTFGLIEQSGVFGVTILSDRQRALSDRFSGHEPEGPSRFVGVETFTQVSGAPFISGGLAFLDCRVAQSFRMPASTLLIGEVLAVQSVENVNVLIYLNRDYHTLGQ